MQDINATDCQVFDGSGNSPIHTLHTTENKDGYMKKYEYVYDEYYDQYICPQGETLPYRKTPRESYRQYASNPLKCQNCPLLSQCTQSQQHVKMIHRISWRITSRKRITCYTTEKNKKIYAQRKETIERVFADAKEKHGMRWTKLRGLKKVSAHAMLIFAAMNLKNW